MKLTNQLTIRGYARTSAERADLYLEKSSELLAILEAEEKFLTVDLWGEDRKSEVVSAQLCMTSHSLWLAAVSMAVSGHVAAVPALLRTSIESMCYASLIAANHSLAEAWGKKLSSKTWTNRFNEKFKNPIKRAEAKVGEIYSIPDQRIYNCYLNMIDFGAHPNEALVSRNFLDMEQAEDETWSGTYAVFHEHPSQHADLGVLMCADVGLALCWLACALYERLGQWAPLRLDDLEMRLQAVVADHRNLYGSL